MAINITEIMARQDLDVMPIEAITFRHPSFSNTAYPSQGSSWRFVSLPDDTVLRDAKGNGHTHIALPFKVAIPERNNELTSDLQIAFTTIDSQIVPQLNAALEDPDETIRFQYQLYSAPRTDIAKVRGTPFSLTMTITDVSIANFMAQMTASRVDLLNREFPNIKYLSQHFPALDR